MDKKYIINLKGKEYVKFEGLLHEFHNQGGKSIHTNIINQTPLIIQATVRGERGEYQGIGDANDENTSALVSKHKIRMAETRAIARALRRYCDIGLCSYEELGDKENIKIEL
jgi:hypothetical protein